MIARKLICLFLAALFLFATFPLALADGTPPPDPGNGDIHPWDNNDGFRYDGGPLTAATTSVIIIWNGPLGELLTTWILLPEVTPHAATTSTVSERGSTDTKRIVEFKKAIR